MGSDAAFPEARKSDAAAAPAINGSGDHIRAEEIAELLNGIKQRVRARYPGAAVAVDNTGSEPVRVGLPDLMPLVRARDAAAAKVAAIGSVNPRAGGPVNRFIQGVKRLIARSLEWFIRDQIVFNREAMRCVETIVETLSETHAALAAMAGHIAAVNQRADDASREAGELRDFGRHWAEWRVSWEKTIATNEMQFLRSVADLQTGFSYRTGLMESSVRETVRGQHAEYLSALDRGTLDLQKRFWSELETVRREYERVIHNELRVLRQKATARDAGKSGGSMASEPALVDGAKTAAFPFDYTRFADRFRGSEEEIRTRQQWYADRFREQGRVLDLGCGRGELLDLLRAENIPARGIDAGEESVAYCRSKGLDVERADLFEYLSGLPEGVEDIIFCSQTVEHLEPLRVPELVRLCASRLIKGGLLVIETPNPECLAIFATHFYLDPTHTRPVPAPLLTFYLEENGMGGIEIHRFAPARESFPAVNDLPEAFAGEFFGGLDYAIFARKLN